jgi:nicotinate-nucleotide adenylyltransferase
LRLGIYGGSFDPVHIGHLLVAETVRDQLKLDKILWIPAFQSPLKQNALPTDAKDRVEMLSLAIGGHPHFELDTREINRGGVSYTIDTIRTLQADQPGNEWFLVIGADSLIDLERWKEPAELCRLTMPVVVARGGMPPPDFNYFTKFVDSARLAAIQKHRIVMPEIEISSRDLRLRTALGQSIRYQVPASVEAFIRNKQLYREKLPSKNNDE